MKYKTILRFANRNIKELFESEDIRKSFSNFISNYDNIYNDVEQAKIPVRYELWDNNNLTLLGVYIFNIDKEKINVTEKIKSYDIAKLMYKS